MSKLYIVTLLNFYAEYIMRNAGLEEAQGGIKMIPKEKKCKKAKWFSEEAFQIAVKRREAKSEGEKEIATDSSILAGKSHGRRNLAGYSPG